MVIKMCKKTSLSILLAVQLLNAFSFTPTLGTPGVTTIDKYNVLNRNGTYDKPTTFSNNLTFNTSFSNNIVVNGDFETGQSNWNLISGSGFVTDYQSAVNHDGQYLWGSSTTGFIIRQEYDMTSTANAKYLNLSIDYGGWNNLDTAEIKISYLNSSNNSVGSQVLSGKLTGKKDDLFKNYFKEINMPNGAKKLIIEIEEIRNSGSDSDGYIDNISAKIRPNKYYATNSSEHILIPDYYKTTYYYAAKGNDLMEALDLERWSERQKYNGNQGNDYIIMPVGNLNNANGNNHDDVCIAYQGNTLTSKSRLNGGGGNDKLYAPIKGTGHIIKGNSGFDMAILRGKKSDYTFTYNSSKGLYVVDNGNVTISIYKDVEAIAFTPVNVLNTVKGNTNETEDIWLFDSDNHILIDVFPLDKQDNIKSVSKTEYPINIDNDISGNFTMYLNGLPNSIIKAIDNSGNLIAKAITKENGFGEINTSLRLPNVAGGQSLNIILIDEQNKVDNYTTPNFDNIRITRGF